MEETLIANPKFQRSISAQSYKVFDQAGRIEIFDGSCHKLPNRPGAIRNSLTAISAMVVVSGLLNGDAYPLLAQAQYQFGMNVGTAFFSVVMLQGWVQIARPKRDNSIQQIFLVKNENNSDFATEVLLRRTCDQADLLCKMEDVRVISESSQKFEVEARH